MQTLFENTEKAFSLKTDSQLKRAHLLFRMIANRPLVSLGTAITNFAIKGNLPVERLIRSTVFDHFCGGIHEQDCMPIIERMHEKGVNAILDYSVEGKETEIQFDLAKDKVLQVLDFAGENRAVPFAVFKPTAFGRTLLYQKVSANQCLDRDEQSEWERIENRFNEVCKRACELDVGLLIDAEESWLQDAADNLVVKMMSVYNKEQAVVFNTAQMYRWDRLDYLKGLAEQARSENFKVGIKLVRGAYMEKESERAHQLGYRNPICESKEATDINFNAGVDFMMHHLEIFSIFLGTHNEKSTYKLIEMMDKMNIAHNDPRIWFGQLYGMSDNISYNLAEAQFLVAKYLPYGPVRDVMPYLIRRAEENTSVSGQTTRELFLIRKEIQRRKQVVVRDKGRARAGIIPC